MARFGYRGRERRSLFVVPNTSFRGVLDQSNKSQLESCCVFKNDEGTSNAERSILNVKVLIISGRTQSVLRKAQSISSEGVRAVIQMLCARGM